MKRAVMLSVFVMALLILAGGARAQTASGKDGLMAKVGFALASMHGEYQAYVAQQGSGEGFRPSNRLLAVRGNLVVIDAVASGDAGALQSDLEALGMPKVAAFGRMVSGQLPIGAIKGMAALGSVKFARPAYAMTRAGSVDSQGDVAMRSNIARLPPPDGFLVDGSGVTVGVLSDSFDCSDGAADDVTSGDLPLGIVVLQEEPGCGSGTDEGRAMMQLIHDVAPGASQAFHTAFNGQADFASGIVELATDPSVQADVIVDDVIYFAEPMFQDGIIAQAVDTVKGMGVSYFSAAGNDSRNAYEKSFAPGGTFPKRFFFSARRAPKFVGGVAHDFNPDPSVVDEFQKITIPPGTQLIISFQWESPFASACVGCPGADTDMDIYLLNDPPTTVLAGGVSHNISGDPVEVFGLVNGGSTGIPVNIMIVQFSGPDPGLMKYVRFEGPGSVTINEFDTASGTVYGHANAAGAEAVGAAFYGDTPEFGTSPPVLESFSSAGPTPILFDTLGNPISEVRDKPEIVAPDGTNTTFFGNDIGADPDTFPNFFGTSAAAPHAAGVAALMLEANAGSTPNEVYTALESTALDMNGAGFDFDSGFGFIQADAAVGAVSEGASPATSTITATPTTIPADGTSTSAITVQLKDANGNNLTTGGDTVALSTDLGTIGAVTDNGDGTYTATLTSETTAGTETVRGTLNGLQITDTATVTLTPGDADATTSLITAAPTSITADGTSTSTITVQLKDANGNNLDSGGDTVTLATDLGSVGLVTDNTDGTYTATLTSATTTGTATITGTVNGAGITDTATVTFEAGATETIEITKATYRSGKGQFKVEATSSLGGPPDTSLTATFFYGTTELPEGGKAMNYNAKKNKWSVTFDSDDGLTTKPDKVKVCSPNTCVERTVPLSSSVTLAWDPNTESDLAGYKVYLGTFSGVYGSPADVGNVTTFQVVNLSQDQTYYFAVTAYDISGNESDYSNEVSASIN